MRTITLSDEDYTKLIYGINDLSNAYDMLYKSMLCTADQRDYAFNKQCETERLLHIITKQTKVIDNE